MKMLLRSLSPCAYFRQTPFIGREHAAFFTVVVNHSGYTFECCKNGNYTTDAREAPDGYRGYVEAYQDYETLAQDYQNKVHIAVITEPEFRSLMKLADFSVVLCTLPPDYDKYKQIHLPHDVPGWAVFYKLQEMAEKMQAGGALEDLKEALEGLKPFIQLNGAGEKKQG